MGRKKLKKNRGRREPFITRITNNVVLRYFKKKKFDTNDFDFRDKERKKLKKEIRVSAHNNTEKTEEEEEEGVFLNEII